MASRTEQRNYFTKYLFRTGIQCPTKLYYKSKNFPESKQSLPFIRHAILNKSLLKSLVLSAYPEGKFIKGNSVPEAASLTSECLQENEAVLFDAIFEYRQMMARLPAVIKNGDDLTVFHIQAKAFDSRKHRLTNNRGQFYPKWQTYLLDFTYQLFILKQNFPDLKLKPVLVLPEKNSLSYTGKLPSLLKPFEEKPKPVEIPHANQQLLVKIDVSEYISKILGDANFAKEHLPKPSFEESLEFLRQIYFKQIEIPAEVGLKCKNCEFWIEENARQGGNGFGKCWQPHFEENQNHVFDLIGPGTNEWVQQGIYNQREISDSDIFAIDEILKAEGHITQKMRQSLQVHKAKGRSIPEEIIRSNLKKELQRWEYPLHFLDFEAGNYAVPVREGRSPYHLVIFQFSCHTLHKDGSLTHHQWIDSFENDYVNYEVIRQLKKMPRINEGTIIQYSNFERHALKTIRRELISERDEINDAEELISWIEKIVRRKDSNHLESPYMVDLSRQVKHFYYNREMGSSLSIKDVLQAVMRHSQFLKQEYSKPYSSHNFDDMIWWQPWEQNSIRNPYQLLTEKGGEGIRRGTEAMAVYGELITRKVPVEELKAYKKSLLRYCELDTLAMVMIYQHWLQEVKKLQ